MLQTSDLQLHPPTQEATAVKLWRNAQWVSSEALAKEDTLRRVPPKTQQGPRLSSRGAPQRTTLPGRRFTSYDGLCVSGTYRCHCL